jgi:hypothetical protein
VPLLYTPALPAYSIGQGGGSGVPIFVTSCRDKCLIKLKLQRASGGYVFPSQQDPLFDRPGRRKRCAHFCYLLYRNKLLNQAETIGSRRLPTLRLNSLLDRPRWGKWCAHFSVTSLCLLSPVREGANYTG